MISTETKIPLKEIPLWKPTTTSTSIVVDNVLHRNLSFDLTCRTEDAKKMKSLLETTFTQPQFCQQPKYAPYQLKQSHPKLFSQLVGYQADLITHLVIAVESILAEHMSTGFKDILFKSFSHISSIYEHRNTHRENDQGQVIGRWNITCPQDSFDKTARSIKDQVGTLYENFESLPNLPSLAHQYFPPVTSNIRVQDIDDEESETTKNSFAPFYETSSIASYTIESTEDQFSELLPTIFGFQPTIIKTPSPSTSKTSSPHTSTTSPYPTATSTTVTKSHAAATATIPCRTPTSEIMMSDITTSSKENEKLQKEVLLMSQQIKQLKMENQQMKERKELQHMSQQIKQLEMENQKMKEQQQNQMMDLSKQLDIRLKQLDE